MTTQQTHTPGPWELDRIESGKYSLSHEEYPDTSGMTGTGIVTYKKDTFAYLSCSREANANLIAAAPDLYESVKAMMHDLEIFYSKYRDEQGQKYLVNLKAALSKAEGRAQ